jgi:acyl-CoA reductase-like NAD-dependent aldehyde dehydrogenase
MTHVDEGQLFIAGQWRAPEAGSRLDVYDPSSGQIIGTAAAAAADAHRDLEARRTMGPLVLLP